MKTIVVSEIEEMEKRYRANLINGLSGAKSANLIGTKSTGGDENLALFSSVIHLGAHPPLLGFIMRPVHVERHTYEHIMDTKRFTINSVSSSFRENAHQTSARYPKGVSEFEACGLHPFYESDFPAPFVQESAVQIGCTLEDDIHIKSNDTRLIVGRIILLRIREDMIGRDGCLDLHGAHVEAITGLDAWHPLGSATRFSFAKPDKPLQTIDHEQA